MDLDQALERYLRHHRASNSSLKTLEYHTYAQRSLRTFLAQCGHPTTIEELHIDHVREWITHRQDKGYAQKTIATQTRAIKAFTHWLAEEEWLPKDPLARLKVPRVDIKAKERLTPEEVEKLLGTCDRKALTGARDIAIMVLLFSTAVRAEELCGLRVEDIDWKQGMLLVRRGKGGKFRTVPLGVMADKAVDKYLEHPRRKKQCSEFVFLNDEGEALTYYALRHMLKRRGEKVGIHANPHKWRHTAAVQYLRNGGRLEHLKALLGHTDFAITLHYAQVAGVDLTEAHDKADPARSLKVRV